MPDLPHEIWRIILRHRSQRMVRDFEEYWLQQIQGASTYWDAVYMDEWLLNSLDDMMKNVIEFWRDGGPRPYMLEPVRDLDYQEWFKDL